MTRGVPFRSLPHASVRPQRFADLRRVRYGHANVGSACSRLQGLKKFSTLPRARQTRSKRFFQRLPCRRRGLLDVAN